MAYSESNLAIVSEGFGNLPKVWVYKSTGETYATISASSYFDPAFTLFSDYDLIYLVGSDDQEIAFFNNVAASGTTVETMTGEQDSLTDGDIWIGNGSNVPTARTISGDFTISNTGVGAISSDVIVNADIKSDAAIALSKFASGTDGQLIVCNGSGVPTYVALSQDATIDNTGALTIAQVLNGANVANVADANTTGGIPVVFTINTAGGGTANTDVTVDNKIRVLDVWVQNNAVGTTSDTIQVTDGTNNITDAIDISGADKTIARAGEVDNANATIAASGTLRVTETDGGGSDSPATTVSILALRVA